MWQIVASGRNLYATVDSTIVEVLGDIVQPTNVQRGLVQDTTAPPADMARPVEWPSSPVAHSGRWPAALAHGGCQALEPRQRAMADAHASRGCLRRPFDVCPLGEAVPHNGRQLELRRWGSPPPHL